MTTTTALTTAATVTVDNAEQENACEDKCTFIQPLHFQPVAAIQLISRGTAALKTILKLFYIHEKLITLITA